MIDNSGTFYTGVGVKNMYGLAYADNTMYGFAGQNVYNINLTNGTSSFIAAISGIDPGKTIYGAATKPSPVPLPSAVVLLGSALMGLSGTRLRKKKK